MIAHTHEGDLPETNLGLNKTSPVTRNLTLALSFCLTIGTTASAQNVAPIVAAPIAGFTEYAGAPARSIDLTAAFSDPDASSAVQLSVLLSSSTGLFNIALDGQHKPITVANFLNYVNSGRYFMIDPTTHTLASSFIHRSVSNFVVQGGGFIGTVNPAQPAYALPTPVPTFSPIRNEPGISNKLGTVAMAKVAGNPNSATSQWFVNLANNGGPPNNLDTQNGGFTVFGHVTGNGMTTVNAIAALPVYNLGSPFDSLPLRNYTSPQFIKVENLVSISAITVIPPLAFSASGDNTAVATASISGKNLLVTGLQPGTAHIMAKATDLDGANVSQTFTVTVTTGPARLANISTRAQVGTGGDVLIGGFIVSGSSSKRILVRSLGPSLIPFGVTNALSDPTLELHAQNGALLFSNDNWGTAANKQEISDTGRAPGSSQEPAILTTLAPGNYTAIVRGAGNSTGVALVEVYDQDSGPGSLLANLSTRCDVGTGANVMIGGVSVTDDKTVLVRALGPTLTQFGVTNVLPNPALELRNAQGALVDSNDNWQTSPHKTQIQATGLAPHNPAEPALYVALPTGNYTAIVRGVGATPTGNALVEVYPQ
jgi:cyclophilin family peptidyl-prolyl cis-trans isomerase